MSPQATDSLQIEERVGSQPDHRVLTLHGPVILGTLFRFQDAIRSKSSPTLIIDFTGVPYIDSAGIGALVGAYVTHNKDGRTLGIVGVSERVMNALKVTRVEKFFRFFPTVDSALQASA
jgi:anti-sigma B factor antagonist